MADETEDTVVLVQFALGLEPMDRYETFEQPLTERLEAGGLGEVVGGGTPFTPGEEIPHCDIEIELKDLTPETIAALVAALEAIPAPVGTRLVVGEDETGREVGRGAAIGLYIDAAGLPDEVYEKYGLDDLLERCEPLIGETGRYAGYRAMDRESVLYFLGAEAEPMIAALRPLLEEHPLCKGASLTPVRRS